LRHAAGSGAAPGTAVRAKKAHAAAIAVLARATAQELVEVVLAWPRLSESDKAGILTIIHGADAPVR